MRTHPIFAAVALLALTGCLGEPESASAPVDPDQDPAVDLGDPDLPPATDAGDPDMPGAIDAATDGMPADPDGEIDARPDVGQAEERCNGLDDDGDSAIDEDFQLETHCAEGGVDGCRVCAADGGWTCEVGRLDQCDGVDADCDGRIDEGPPCNRCSGVAAVGEPHLRPWMHIPDGWICVPAGTDCMGSPQGDVGRQAREGVHRTVRISRAFLMRATETTQAEWIAAGNGPACNPSVARNGLEPDCDAGPPAPGQCVGGAGGDCPVNGVTWYDAAWHAEQASRSEGLSRCYAELVGARCEGEPGRGYYCPPTADSGGEPPRGLGPACSGYRLPTEAEWEYAARAGADGPFGAADVPADAPCQHAEVSEERPVGPDEALLYTAAATRCPEPTTGTADEQAAEQALAPLLCPQGWFVGNSGCGLHGAGLKAPNRWGLYDMHGNLHEWVNDWRNGDPRAGDDERCGVVGGAPIVDPLGPTSGVPADFANYRTADSVLRGGAYHAPGWTARSATIHATPQDRGSATVGYRLVRTLAEPVERTPCGGPDDAGFCLPSTAGAAAACGRLDEDEGCATGIAGGVCCVDLPCAADDGRSGTCRGRDACAGATLPGLCPGNTDVACCLD